ncbi:MAG: biotin/lipoyl-containing protein, partial [Burkholderiaceae bacterium]
MSLVEVKVPDIGDFKEVEVIEVLVKAGDTIKPEQSLITVESDKASMEIPSSTAGVVKEVKVKIGDKVAEGSIVLLLEAGATAAVPAAAPAPSPVASVAPAAAAPVSSAGPVEVRVPDIGDFKDVEVIEVLVKVGDSIKAEQSLVTVESDKASMEIPSSSSGVIKELRIKLGDKVNKGDVVALLEGAATTPASATVAPASTAAASASVTAAPVPAPVPGAAKAAPVVEDTAPLGKKAHA